MPGPRYTDWTHVHVRGDRDAAAPHVPLGRKMLGYLAQQRESGVQTQEITRKLTDGTFVRARFIGDIPRIEIIPATNQLADAQCSLYMESGLIDLGANLAANAYDQPIVADAAPAFRFDGASSCDATPMQGTLVVRRVNGNYSFSGQCLASKDPEPVPRCCDAVPSDTGWSCTRLEKLTAQARVQSSLWTGLMHRYVQAQYGTPDAKYRSFFDSFTGRIRLEVPASGEGEDVRVFLDYQWPETWLLIDPGQRYDYLFVKATDTELTFYRSKLRSRCGELLQQALRNSSAGAMHDRAETYLLSQVVPDATEAFTIPFVTPVVGLPQAYGWKTNERGSEIAVVCYDKDTLTQRLYKRRIVVDRSQPNGFRIDEVDEVAVDFQDSWRNPMPGSILGPWSNNRTMMLRSGRDSESGFLGNALATDSWDAPVYCYYINDADGRPNTLEVVKSKVIPGTAVTFPGHCWGSPPLPDDPFVYAGYLDDSPCAFKDNRHLTNVARGYYTARYSSVRMNTMQVTSTFSELSAFQVGKYEVVMAVERSSDAMTYSSAVASPVCPSEGGPPGGFSVSPCYEAQLGPFTSSDGLCSVTIDTSGPGLPIPTVTFPDCPETIPGFLLTGIGDTITQSQDTVKYSLLTRGAEYTQVVTDGKPTILIIPACSATGVFFHEFDGYMNHAQVVKRVPFVATDLAIKAKVSGTAVRQCGYCAWDGSSLDCSDGHTTSTTLTGTFDPGDWGSYKYIIYSLTAPGLFEGAMEDVGNFTSATEETRVFWMGRAAGLITTPLYQETGTLYSEFNPSNFLDAVPSSCADMDFTKPSLINDPIVSYAFTLDGTRGEFDNVIDGTGTWMSITPIEVRISAGGLEAKMKDLITMTKTFPLLDRDTPPGYAPFGTVPSFIGAA
jgi:hypothetical protein